MKKTFFWTLAAVGLIVGWVVSSTVRAETTFPTPTALVNDYTNTLSKMEKYTLEKKLEVMQKKVQFVVAIVDNMNGDEVAPYANKMFKAWGVGKKGDDRGLLLLIAKTERKVRFEVGYGLEPVFTDHQSKDVLV